MNEDGGIGVAQLVERQTEKPGAILTRFQVPVRQIIFLPESASSADSLTVSVHPPCAIACITSVCTLTIPNAGSCTVVWTHKNTTHTDRNG